MPYFLTFLHRSSFNSTCLKKWFHRLIRYVCLWAGSYFIVVAIRKTIP